MPDINDTSTTGVLQSLMKQYQDRMNPGEYQRQVQGRNALIDEYEQGVRNAPPGMSQFQMGVSNWLGAGGTGPNDIVRGVGNAQSQFAKQQLSQHEARQQGLLDTAKMRDLIAKEEDAALKAQIGLLSKRAGESGIDKLTLQQQVALRTAVNAAAESIRKNNPNLPAPEALAQALEQVSATTGFDKGDIIGKLYGSGTSGVTQTAKPDIGTLAAPVEPAKAEAPADTGINAISIPKGTKPDAENAIIDQFRKAQFLIDNPATRQQGIVRMNALKALYPKEAVQAVAPQNVQSAQAKPAGTTNETALEQGYTQDFLNKAKESPFAVGLPMQPVLTRQLPATELKQVNDQRDAYLKSPEIKSLEEQSSGAKELRKYVQNAIDNPAKTNSLSSIVQTFNSYAKAAGLPLSEDAETQLREFAKLNQTEKAIGLMGQLMQRGVQTDKDFVRIIQSSFDTSLSPEQRRVVMRQYMDNLNKTINKQQFFNDYVGHPFSKGQERNWENSYSQMLDAGMPESVYMPNKKVVPYREAAEALWSSDVGKAFKPSKSDTPEEMQSKINRTISVLKKNDARMRDKLKTGAE